MEEKIYTIAGKKFKLKKFEDYSHNEEEKIKTLLGLSDEENTVQLNTTSNNHVFPLLLIAVDAVEVDKFDFNQMTNGQVWEIISDWIVSRIFFTQNMGSYFANLLQKKMQLILNTDANMEPQKNIDP